MAFSPATASANSPRQDARFVDCSPKTSLVDSSLEGNTSHCGSANDASELLTTPSTAPSADDSIHRVGNGVFGAGMAQKYQPRSRTSSMSKVYSATLSKLSIKLYNGPATIDEKQNVLLSVGKSCRAHRVFRRRSLVDFQPPHCERKQFDDGTIVHMIGSAAPPRIAIQPPPETDINYRQSESDPTIASPVLQMLDIRIRPDSFFGTEGIGLQLEEDSSRTEGLSTGGGVESQGDAGALSLTSGGVSNEEPVLLGSPCLPDSLVPRLTPMSTDLSPLLDRRPMSEDHEGFFTPPLGSSNDSPDLGTLFPSPVLPNISPGATPTLSPMETTSEESSPMATPEIQLHEAGGPTIAGDEDISVDAVANVSADVDAYLRDLSSDIEKISLVSIDSLSLFRYRDSVEHRGRRWETLSQPTGGSSFNIQASPELTQIVESMSSASLLAPLTQADFDASFEQIFRVSYPVVSNAIQRSGKGAVLDMTHPRAHRRSHTSVPQLRVVPPSSP